MFVRVLFAVVACLGIAIAALSRTASERGIVIAASSGSTEEWRFRILGSEASAIVPAISCRYTAAAGAFRLRARWLITGKATRARWPSDPERLTLSGSAYHDATSPVRRFFSENHVGDSTCVEL